MLVVAGRGGEAQYEERFTKWSQQVAHGLGDRHRRCRAGAGGLAGERTRDREQDHGGTAHALRSTARPAISFVLVLLGHGSFDGSEYRFNISGR